MRWSTTWSTSSIALPPSTTPGPAASTRGWPGAWSTWRPRSSTSSCWTWAQGPALSPTLWRRASAPASSWGSTCRKTCCRSRARRHYLSLPRYSSDRSRFGEPDVLPQLLGAAGFDVTRVTEMVTGGRAKDARDWTELMAGAGPLPFTLIRSLGPRYRDELEAEVEAAMASLGDPDDAFRYHHSYVLAVATKR